MELVVSNNTFLKECTEDELYDINAGGFWAAVAAVSIVVVGVCVVCFIAGCAYEYFLG